MSAGVMAFKKGGHRDRGPTSDRNLISSTCSAGRSAELGVGWGPSGGHSRGNPGVPRRGQLFLLHGVLLAGCRGQSVLGAGRRLLLETPGATPRCLVSGEAVVRGPA